ncbi:hypothetical protein H8959_001797 [Pygathrix nigripes]
MKQPYAVAVASYGRKPYEEELYFYLLNLATQGSAPGDPKSSADRAPPRSKGTPNPPLIAARSGQIPAPGSAAPSGPGMRKGRGAAKGAGDEGPAAGDRRSAGRYIAADRSRPKSN